MITLLIPYNKMKAIIMIAFIFFNGIIFLSCDNKNEAEAGNSKLLTEVYNKKLKESDIDIKYLKNIDKKDSLNLIHSYTEHWIRKQLLAKNAENYVKNINEINRLVEDYKNSLLVEAFQKQYIKEKLDTVISNKQMREFYNENMENFHLDHAVVRLLYAKIDAKKKYLDKFYENWKEDKFNAIYSYGSKNSEKFFLKLNKWYDLNEIKKEIPKFLQKNKRQYKVQKNVNGYEYFLKVIETRYKNEITPLSLIEDKVQKLIIEKRKSHLLDEYIEELYKQEIKNKNVKIYY